MSAGHKRSIVAVIPLYNGEKYIEAAIRSVAGQTLQPAEIIVVDDGSTDGGPDIVRRLAKDIPIKLLHKPNGGQSSARNFGVAHSKCNLIAFLDQDDDWYPTHLEKLRAPFDEDRATPLGWVYSSIDKMDEQGSTTVRSFTETISRTHPKRSLIECLREDMMIWPTCCMITRKAFEEVGGFDERLSGYEDDDLFLRIHRAGYDNIYLAEPLGRWRFHGGSSSLSVSMSRSRVIFMKKLLAMFPDDPDAEKFLSSRVIVPRFVPHFVREIELAAIANDRHALQIAIEDFRLTSPYLGKGRKALLELIVFLLQYRFVCVIAIKAKPILSPIWRKMI